jgi:RecJ-like exonuclease
MCSGTGEVPVSKTEEPRRGGADMTTCEVCGAVYPTNGLRGAIHEPSACRDVLAALDAAAPT